MKPAGLMQTVSRLFHIVTDWLLILLGIAMFVVAFRAIDVAAVQYGVMAFGLVLTITGLGCRFSRLRKQRHQDSL